jgi:hypothetical protein
VSKVLYYHLNSFPEISARDEYRLATSFGLHSPRFRHGFDNQLDLIENPLYASEDVAKYKNKINFPANFTSTFEELTNRRAVELWDIGKPIRLWWSGGIDSTCALVSLLKTRRLDTRLTVYLSTNSVQENPRFYDLLVNKKVKLEWHSHKNYIYDNIELWNGQTINVNGNGGDELFLAISSTMSIEEFFKIKDSDWINVIKDKDSDMLNVIKKYIDISPYKPKTCWELLWWFARSIDDLSTRYHSPRFLKDPSVYHLEHAFFYTDYFEKWALSNPYAGHNGDYGTYKWPMKKYIYDYDKNEEYLNTKQKESSFPLIYKKQSRYLGISRGHYVLNKIVYEDGTYVRYK